MKKFVLIFLLMMLNILLYSQNNVPLDTVINYSHLKSGKCISINIFDTVTVEVFKKSYKKFDPYIKVNNYFIDSSYHKLNNPLPLSNKILFNGVNENRKPAFYIYDLKTKKLVESNLYQPESNLSIDCGYTTYYSFTNSEDVKVFLDDVASNEKKLFVNITKYAGWLKYPDGSKKISSDVRQCLFFGDKNAIIFLDNDYDDGGYSNYKYLKIDNGKVIDLTEKLTNSYHWITIKMLSSGRNYLKTFDEILAEKFYTLRDKNLNFICNSLIMGGYYPYYVDITQVGINLQKGEIENYFLRSQLNDENYVIVPYKFIPKLDIAMYKAYNDTLLTNDEVAGFGKYELGILRNLIFAKHNYDFSTEFYQAYFNLYAFYNNEEMRKTRTKDVNGKLTETDKANLKLIKEQEAKISQ